MSPDNRSRQNQARFDEAAKNYFSPALSFFDVLGGRLIGSLGVSTGDRVIDFGCGTGALTVPAAERVGNSGEVVGTDISAGMLRVASKRSQDAGHDWVEYHEGDIASLELGGKFDYGVCGFVTQMFNDLTTVPKTLAKHVRPGGKIGLSVWAEGSWEPHTSFFREVLTGYRPDLVANPKPGSIEKLQEPGVIESIMAESGVSNVEVTLAKQPHRLPDFDEYWHLISTLGARPILEKMNDPDKAELKKYLNSAIGEISATDGGITLCMDALFVTGEV